MGNAIDGDLMDVQGVTALGEPGFVQPRAAVYRRATSTLLVAGEGDNVLAELDARALDPSLVTRRIYRLAQYQEAKYPFPRSTISGGAPSAIALSADEKMAWVFCRSTYDLAIVSLDEQGPIPFVHLADDPLGEHAAEGRRLFYDATDSTVSGGLACSGCHPEGRDDGHVWHEIVNDEELEVSHSENMTGYRGTTVVSAPLLEGKSVAARGFARQTPMLAGRVGAVGPYGWRAESPTLEVRIRHGFSLHRWGGERDNHYAVTLDRPKHIAAFVRQGLVAPTVPERALSSQEERGKALFSHDVVGCASCHAPASGFTDRIPIPLKRVEHRGFDPEPNIAFKTPSLLFVAGTPPYFHDGAAMSLEELVTKNGTTMGNTARLSPADQAALAAYVRTIGGYVEPFPEEDPPALPDAPKLYTRGERPGQPPLRAAWKDVKVSARNDQGCEIRRIHHWVHIECPAGFGIAPIAGNTTGIERWFGPRENEFDPHGRPALVLSVQAGDRRVVQLTMPVAFGRWGTRTASAGVVSAHWLEGDAAPTIAFD
jgi:hypothetical protein